MVDTFIIGLIVLYVCLGPLIYILVTKRNNLFLLIQAALAYAFLFGYRMIHHQYLNASIDAFTTVIWMFNFLNTIERGTYKKKPKPILGTNRSELFDSY